jgi:hypothetical protein
MSTWIRRIVIVLGVGLFATGVALAVLVASDPFCDNTMVADVPSPDGGRHAVVVGRDCGRPTGPSTQVAVHPKWRSGKRMGGNVLMVDRFEAGVRAGPGGGPRVTVRWLDNRTLEVRYDARARVLGSPVLLRDDTDVLLVADST